MWLASVWYFLFVAIISGYMILDGFDLGVGILHMFVARSDEERRLSLNSIGPIWDGNEVWLVTGGGVLMGVFPIVYATLFSEFYPAMMLLLFFLILRTVALEFRSKREGVSWRRTWDLVFSLASGFLAVLLGVALGNIIRGVPINAQGQITVSSLAELLHPFALLVGATTVVMLALHGAIYLTLKTEADLQMRARSWIRWLLPVFALLGASTALLMVLQQHQILAVYDNVWPLIFPLGGASACAGIWYCLRRGREFGAFICSATMVALLIFSVAVGLYPNLLISTIDPQNSLTVSNAASAQNTLTVVSIMALIGIPFVLLYTAGVYYIFRGKVRISQLVY